MLEVVDNKDKAKYHKEQAAYFDSLSKQYNDCYFKAYIAHQHAFQAATSPIGNYEEIASEAEILSKLCK